MAAKSGSLLISVRSPCLAESGEVEAHLDWTVLRVKEEVATRWADHPRPEDQRLIHAGKMLENSSFLKDVLRLDEDLTHYTVYLVRRQSAATSAAAKPSSQSSSSEGLRRRNVPASSQPTAAAQVPDAADQWQAYFQQFSGQQNADAMMQQAYAQYMSQYMQLWNYHNVATASAMTAARQSHTLPDRPFAVPPPPHQQLMQGGGGAELGRVAAVAAAAVVGQPALNAAAPPQVAPAVAEAAQPPAAPRRPQMDGNNLNGGGGGNAGEFDGGQRDALDWIRITWNVVVLLSIIHLYSSLARFALVVGFGLAIYMYRLGIFGGGGAPDGMVNNQEEVVGNDVNANDGNNDGQEEGGPPQNNNNDNNVAAVAETPQQQQPQQTWPSVALTFVTTFFTSLMPNEPQVV